MDRLPIFLIVSRQGCTPCVWKSSAGGALLLFTSSDAAGALAHALNQSAEGPRTHVVVEITSYQQLASWVQTIMSRCNEVWWDATGRDELLPARVDGLAEFVSTLLQSAERESREPWLSHEQAAPPRR